MVAILGPSLARPISAHLAIAYNTHTYTWRMGAPTMRPFSTPRFRALRLYDVHVTAAALNMSVFLLIGKTSALTMNVAGVIKDWLLILLSVLLYG